VPGREQSRTQAAERQALTHRAARALRAVDAVEALLARASGVQAAQAVHALERARGPKELQGGAKGPLCA
jgi:hypothetical protein